MLEKIILGIVQGIAEWLPVSSEGLIVLIKAHFSPQSGPFSGIIKDALFLHLGTFFAALVYFRRDVFVLSKAVFFFKKQTADTRKLTVFLVISTIISGILGLILLKTADHFFTKHSLTGKSITLMVGGLLMITALLELKGKTPGYKHIRDLKIIDSVLLGIAQGFAALPGLSRSGLTTSSLLLRKFDKTVSLKLSFLTSLPIVFAGNILLNMSCTRFSFESLAGLLCSFLFGLLTIHVLLKVAEKINFGLFMLGFGFLTILAGIL